MFGLSIWELLVILAIVLLVFGTKRLSNLGSDLGTAIKGFRNSMADENQAKNSAIEDNGNVIEGEAQPADKTRQESS